MQFTSALLSVAALSSAVFAAPIEERAEVTYYLQTKSADSRFNNLYLEAYHTGAGFNDVTLSTEKPSFVFYTNNTHINAALGSGPYDTYGLSYPGNTMYDEWYPSSFNAGYGSSGYSFNKNGDLENTAQSGEQGWLACYWAHSGVPQLFETVVPYPKILSNCASVNVTKAH